MQYEEAIHHAPSSSCTIGRRKPNTVFLLCRLQPFAAAFKMLLWEGKKPIILLLGEVILAHAEWNDLGALAELRVSRICKTHRAER